jgi:hypothetical protein
MDVPPARKPLRLWPGVVLVVLLLLARFGVKAAVGGFKGFTLGMKWPPPVASPTNLAARRWPRPSC